MSAGRSWAAVLVGVLMAGLLVQVVFQLRITLQLLREMPREKCVSMLTLLAQETRQIARFGPFAQERIQEAFTELVRTSDVRCVDLVDEGGRVRGEGGACVAEGLAAGLEPPYPDTPSCRSTGAGRMTAAIGIDVGDPASEERGPVSGGELFPVPGGMPSRQPSGFLSGRLSLRVVMDTSRDERIARGAVYPSLFLMLTLLLLFGAFLWLNRVQRRSWEAENALALVQQRNRHLQAVQMMAAGVAHEIKNPLGTIRGFAQLTRKRFPPGSREHRYLDITMKELDRINERVARLLHFARPRRLNRTSTDMHALVLHVLELLEPDLRARGLTASLHVAPSLPLLDVDAAQVQELVVNLVLNAVEASEEGQGVDIRCGVRDGGRGRALRLEVTDRGRGMDPEARALAFEPYYTTKEKGSGLGLANCLRIVEAHGGAIRVESEPGRGTRVVVDIPVDSGLEERNEQRPSIGGLSGA